MKKSLILWSVIISSVWLSFALNSNSLKTNLNSSYTTANTNATNIYKKYENLVSNIDDKMATWDYVVLSQLTWINTNNLDDTIKTQYTNLIRNITTKKLNIIWEIDINNNSLKNNLITTWDYNNKLNEIQSNISWYILDSNTSISNFNSNLSWEINTFNTKLTNTLKYYQKQINEYKDFKSKLNSLKKNYNNLITNNTKLDNIIWLGKDILNKKSEEIKNNVTNYYSWFLNNEFENYVKKDSNMTYYQSGFNTKKQVLLWFVNDNLVNVIWNITKNYYPDINVNKISSWVNELKDKGINNIIKNYNDLVKNINNLNNEISDANNKINKKLNKFGNSDSKINIFKILQNDIIKKLNEVTKVVQQDISTTLKNYFNFIQTKEKVEKPIMTQLMINYNTKMSKDSLTWLNTFVETLKNYKNIVVLPENLNIINKYIKATQTEIENIKLKKIISKLSNLKNTIKNLQISNNFDKINELSWEITKLENTVPEQFKKQLKQDKYLLKIKWNLNQLFKVWAIRFYYEDWDLSHIVENILNKYYNKYKKENKENIFNEKVNKAFEKLQILESSLTNDKRSYYIIMIDNGLLKFKSDLLK